MNSIDQVTDVIELGGCVVIGIGVSPERYRLLLKDASIQDYLVIGAKDSADAGDRAAELIR